MEGPLAWYSSFLSRSVPMPSPSTRRRRRYKANGPVSLIARCATRHILLAGTPGDDAEYEQGGARALCGLTPRIATSWDELDASFVKTFREECLPRH